MWLIPKQQWIKSLHLNEDRVYIPRFKLKDTEEIFPDFPIGEEVKYSEKLIARAIQYGMVITIAYRGAEDTDFRGHIRTIYPMVLGLSAKGKPLLRGFHLEGFSVSGKGRVEKTWRMFRADRILSMRFTGSFYRMPPDGYNMYDRGMRGGIKAVADFDVIRRNQLSLVRSNKVQNRDEGVIGSSDRLEGINVEWTETTLDLSAPWDNKNLEKTKANYTRLTFLVSNQGKTMAVLGALGEKNKKIKMYTGNKFIGEYKVLQSVMGTALGKKWLEKVDKYTSFPLYVFKSKREIA